MSFKRKGQVNNSINIVYSYKDKLGSGRVSRIHYRVYKLNFQAKRYSMMM